MNMTVFDFTFQQKQLCKHKLRLIRNVGWIVETLHKIKHFI